MVTPGQRGSRGGSWGARKGASTADLGAQVLPENLPSDMRTRYRVMVDRAAAEGVELIVKSYTRPRPATPPQPDYRLVCADDRAGAGLLAAMPMLPPRRGPKPTLMVLPIVAWNGDAFVVKTHARVAAEHFGGMFATLTFEDGHFLLDPDDDDTGFYDTAKEALLAKAGPASMASVAPVAPVAITKKRPAVAVADSIKSSESESEDMEAHGATPKRAKRKSHQLATVRMAVQ